VNANDQVILSGPGIHTGFQTVGAYEIYLEWQAGFQSIHFRIVEANTGYFQFYQSHFFKYPGDIEPYQTTGRTATTQSEALRLGVQSIMTNYNLAVGRGLSPQSNWFVKNDDY
jgi:hypothetical protein